MMHGQKNIKSCNICYASTSLVVVTSNNYEPRLKLRKCRHKDSSLLGCYVEW